MSNNLKKLQESSYQYQYEQLLKKYEQLKSQKSSVDHNHITQFTNTNQGIHYNQKQIIYLNQNSKPRVYNNISQKYTNVINKQLSEQSQDVNKYSIGSQSIDGQYSQQGNNTIPQNQIQMIMILLILYHNNIDMRNYTLENNFFIQNKDIALTYHLTQYDIYYGFQTSQLVLVDIVDELSSDLEPSTKQEQINKINELLLLNEPITTIDDLYTLLFDQYRQYYIDQTPSEKQLTVQVMHINQVIPFNKYALGTGTNISDTKLIFVTKVQGMTIHYQIGQVNKTIDFNICYLLKAYQKNGISHTDQI